MKPIWQAAGFLLANLLAVVAARVDRAWHQANPGTAETGWAVWEAHGLFAVATAVALATTVVTFRASTGLLRTLAAVAGVIFVLDLLGQMAHNLLHATGSDVAAVHVLLSLTYRPSNLAMLGMIVVAAWPALQKKAEAK